MHFLRLSLLFLSLLPPLTTPHPCTQHPTSPCPPFNSSSLSFPFSFTSGCGHPSFLLKCSANHSLISINNLTFSLLRYDVTSLSLLLSPVAATSTATYPSIPERSIDLSGSPFRVSDSTCERLSLLKPCAPRALPSCSESPWLCTLYKNPARLVQGCEVRARPISDQGCEDDVLGFLDRFLGVQGLEIEWGEDKDEYFMKCRGCQIRNGVCGFNSTDLNKGFVCFEEEISVPESWIQRRKMGRITVVSVVFVLICLFCLVFVVFFVFKNKRLVDSVSLEDPTAVFLHRHRAASRLPPVFAYEELEVATNRFDPKRKIGDGGFGSVYLGQLYDGRIVAVKHLHRHRHRHHHQQPAVMGGGTITSKSFCNEILILSSIEHPNLVKLHGYCSDPRGLILVYDYIPNGTLADHLHGLKKGSLNWQIRVDIAVQIAMAIEYLHFSVHPPIVHRDVTSSNIFMDQNMRVRVGDFGMSRLLVCPDPNSSGELSGSGSGCVWTGPQGTPGYLDPDYHTSFRLTEKSDIYSFGVVLLELVTGMRAVDRRREKRDVALVDMAVAKIQMGLLYQVVDPVVAMEGEAESVAAVAELAFQCVAVDKDDRPDAKEVVAELRRIWNRTCCVKGSNSNVVVVPSESRL